VSGFARRRRRGVRAFLLGKRRHGLVVLALGTLALARGDASGDALKSRVAWA
jgi:hypothetical protein